MNISPASCTLHHVWVDLELTGLETELDEIVEFGVIGTNRHLEPLFRKTIVVRPTRHGLDRIRSNPIVLNMMTDNGLLAELEDGLSDGTLPTVGDAESQILAAIAEFVPRPGQLILAGSGVFHCDFRFLRHHTPALAALLDDRDVYDVGVERRRYLAATGVNLTDLNDGKNHRAAVDIECHRQEGLAFEEMFRTHAQNRAYAA